MTDRPLLSHDENFESNKLAMENARYGMTILIGSLDRIEKKMGHLWGENLADDVELTDEQARFEEMYEELRKSILDNGHAILRKMERNLENYDIKWKALKV